MNPEDEKVLFSKTFSFKHDGKKVVLFKERRNSYNISEGYQFGIPRIIFIFTLSLISTTIYLTTVLSNQNVSILFMTISAFISSVVVSTIALAVFEVIVEVLIKSLRKKESVLPSQYPARGIYLVKFSDNIQPYLKELNPQKMVEYYDKCLTVDMKEQKIKELESYLFKIKDNFSLTNDLNEKIEAVKTELESLRIEKDSIIAGEKDRLNKILNDEKLKLKELEDKKQKVLADKERKDVEEKILKELSA